MLKFMHCTTTETRAFQPLWTLLGACSAVIAMSLLFCTYASARDMQGRLGLGYNNEFVNKDYQNGVPGVSIKYGLTRDIAVEGILGISTSTPRNSVVGLKFFKNIFFETNLNFYFTAGVASVAAESRSGAEFLGAFGAEAFIPGLESLGFAMETGASLDNLSGSFALKTLGVSFLNAGIRFYF
jgi:hypothetical protein